MSNHANFTAAHRPFAAIYNDAAARAAATGFPRGESGAIVAFDPADLYKFALQLSDSSIWMLTDDSPITWAFIGGATLRYICFEFGDGKNSSSLEANQLTRVPYVPAGTIIRARIEGDVSGSAVVNIKKSTTDPPSYAGICASAKPTLTADIFADDTTLTGWTTTLAAGNGLLAELESVTTCKQVTVELLILQSA